MWLKHLYGSQIKIWQSYLTQTWLTELSLVETRQPRLNQLIQHLYQALLWKVIDEEFPTISIIRPSRMAVDHPQEGQIQTTIIAPHTRVISVNLARAGTWPSHICYSMLNEILDPHLVRQDHIFAARKSNSFNQISGTEIGSHKIGGDKHEAIVLFPDPMGATGHTILAALNHYHNEISGQAKKFIALHLIVTPEYLKRVISIYPDLIIYACRVDRGLSSEKVLKSIPGEYWDEEKGLNSSSYIVPGAGGLGELLNNSFI